MAKHNELGKIGEELALKLLKTKGYQILGTNWHSGHEEIDIIAKDGDVLVIVEVKTRATTDFGEPEFAVNKHKQNSIIRTADKYIQENNWCGDTRFDVVSIVISKNEKKIDHIEDAFYPTM